MDHNCEIYLRLRGGALPAAGDLDAALREAAPSALLITGLPGGAGGGIAELLEIARGQNLAILIEEDWSLARELDMDGVHIRADAERLAEARRALGANKSIGVSCGLSRHEAMLMAEAGADYVAFGETGAAEPDERAEMIGWWSEVFEVPCVAWLRDGEGFDEAGDLVRAGADFLAVEFKAGDAGHELSRLRELTMNTDHDA
ncbi:MAG: thiamine phosphate synthase [Rhodomicrobiaceae bacterium]